jgi:hypothetical protein
MVYTVTSVASPGQSWLARVDGMEEIFQALIDLTEDNGHA